MSGFLCIFHRDRAPADPRVAQRMLATLDHRGSDGADLTTLSHVVLGHQHFWTTPEEVGERQPLSGKEGSLTLVFDGRLDNRADLLQALNCQDPTLSDARLILYAYERWGTDCVKHLLGPFAFALYDHTQRAAFCARDALGDRTLYYYLDARVVVVASEEQAILQYPTVTTRVNESRLASYFALEHPTDGSTFFTDVTELLPAHILRVGEDDHRTWRYWDVDARRRVRYQTDEEYGEHFHALLDESVACRLRTSAPAAVMMSGGLDSTSVAALASLHLRQHFPAVQLCTISYVFDELTSCDERWFMEAMTTRYHTEAIQFPGDDGWPLCDVDTWPLNPNTPEDNLYRRLLERVYRIAHERGTRTILTGGFGDDLYAAGARYWLADLLKEGRVHQAVRESVWELRRYGFHRLARRNLLPLLGWHWLRKLRPRTRPTWLTTEAQALLPESDSWPVSAATAARPEQHQTILGLRGGYDIAAETVHTSRAGVELRLPYRDRRLVEFMLAIPAHQLYRHGLYKHVLRMGMRGVLPERIRRRRHPTSLTPLFVRGIVERERDTVRRLIANPACEWPRYVRSDWLQRVPPGARASEMEELILWLCVCFERWHGNMTRIDGQRRISPHMPCEKGETSGT